jgi:transcriptional regulator with XRE-family HTH domain
MTHWNSKAHRDLANARAREIITAAKNVPCMDCKKRFDLVCMDFDHRPGEVKLFCVGAYRVARDKLLAEIAKCDVVCSNCHRLRTHVLRKKYPSNKVPKKQIRLRPDRTVWCVGFGKRLTAALARIGMKHRAFAEAMGVSKIAVSAWVNGVYIMAPKHIRRAAKVLKVGSKKIVSWIHDSLMKELSHPTRSSISQSRPYRGAVSKRSKARRRIMAEA